VKESVFGGERVDDGDERRSHRRSQEIGAARRLLELVEPVARDVQFLGE
jgi:hypothetical protein